VSLLEPRSEAEVEPRVVWRRAYALLGTLLLVGIDAERLAVVRALPPLAERLPAEVELDGLAAEHYALFGHEVFPFAGVFTGDAGLVGEGAATSVLRAAHGVVGVEAPDDPSPDHLGHGLRILGILVDAERQARASGQVEDARVLERWQRRVLDESLLPWMPPLLVALAGQPASVWTRVIEMAIGVLAQHRVALGGLPQVLGRPAEAAAGDVQAVLDDPRTGLVTVAEVLVTPARSGVYLARRDVEALARRCDLPHGFGPRQGMLERLLRGAAEYRELPRVLDALRQLLQARDDAYAGLEQEPGLAPHVPAWRQRVAGSQRLVERLREAAQQVG
jgi:TorA maturation chaperone TorD